MYLSLYYLSWVSSREDIPASSNSRTFILKANFEFEFYHADKASTLMYMRTLHMYKEITRKSKEGLFYLPLTKTWIEEMF